jgi:uncharacterized protein YacL
MNNAEKTEQWQAQAKRDGVSIPDVMLAYTEMIDSHDAGALSAGMVYTFFSDTCDRKIFHALQPIRLVFDRLHQYNMLFRVLPLVIAFVFVAVFRILNITPDTMYARAVIIFPLLMVVLATYTLSAMVKRQWSTLVQIEQHIKNLLIQRAQEIYRMTSGISLSSSIRNFLRPLQESLSSRGFERHCTAA